MKVKQFQTSLPFPSLIIMLCRRARVVWSEKTDVEVTPSESTNIKRIEAEYLKDEEDKAIKQPTDKMLIVDIEALESSAVELGTKAGISFSSPIIYSFAAFIPSTKTEATNDQSPVTRATIFAIGYLAKVADLRATRVESFVPKLVDPAIAKALKPYVEA